MPSDLGGGMFGTLSASDWFALFAMIIAIISAIFSGRCVVLVERARQRFELSKSKIDALKSFQESMNRSIYEMDRLADQRSGNHMSREQTLEAMGILNRVVENYRNEKYVFSESSRVELDRVLAFIEESAGSSEAFDQLQAFPQLIKMRVVEDLAALHRA